jgi:hypothetical protein
MGSGTVNASHKIYVALWDSADFSSGPPAAVKSLDTNKGRTSRFFLGTTAYRVILSDISTTKS